MVSNANTDVDRSYVRIKRLRAIVRKFLATTSELLQAREGPYRGKFTTRSAAESAAARRGKRVGYDHPEAAEIYLHELRSLRTSDYPVIYWLEKRLHPNFRIFDWGGNLGHSYYAYRDYLNYPTNLTWTICDVPEIAQAGERLARRWDSRGLHFTTVPEECDGYDVLLISGALQYMPRSLSEVLDALLEKPSAIVINRTPVHATLGYFTLQDIGPAICPYQIFVESTLIQTLAKHGYALRDRWPCEGKSIRIPFQSRATIERYTGFFFERGAPVFDRS